MAVARVTAAMRGLTFMWTPSQKASDVSIELGSHHLFLARRRVADGGLFEALLIDKTTY
jgi:hypothetical protein